jgi:hypothetical protein
VCVERRTHGSQGAGEQRCSPATRLWVTGATPPHTDVYLYNVRYGAQMVAPAALFVALLIARVSVILPSRLRLVGYVTLLGLILFQSALTTSQGIISLEDGLYNYACQSFQQPTISYLEAHYNGGKILQDVYATQFDVTEAGLDFKNVIYEGSSRFWLRALHDPANSVEWIIVKPDSPLDVVAQHLNQDPGLLSQFTLVLRQSNNVLLYHHVGRPPLPNRPVPPPVVLEHHPCIEG